MKENAFEGRFELARLTCCFALQIVAAGEKSQVKLLWSVFDFRSEKEALSVFVCGCHCVAPEGPQVVRVGAFMWSSCVDLRSLCLVAGVETGRNLNGDRQVLPLVSWYVSRGLQLILRDSLGRLGWFRDHHPSGSADRKLLGKYHQCGV